MSFFKIKSNIKMKHKLLNNFFKKKILYYNTIRFRPDYDIPIYYSPFSSHIGIFEIKKKLNIKINLINKIYCILKDFFVLLRYLNICTYAKTKNINHKNVILTWGTDENILKDGSFNDRYLNVNSKKNKEIYWVIIFLGLKKPKKLNKNLLLIYVNKKRSYNFFKILIYIISKFKFLFKSLQYFLFSISSFNFLSEKVLEIVKNRISNNVKSFLFIYESQPFQNRLIKYLKRINVKSTGYIHFPPLALPIHLIKKKYSPDKLVLNGIDQKKCFQKLGWHKNDIKIYPSSRFLKKKIDFKNKIFLPITIKSSEVIIKNLENIILKQKINLKSFKIQNHPFAEKSKTHLKLINDINRSILKYTNKKIKFKKNKKFSIFIGASGAIIEALERGNKVIQIAEEPLLDHYSSYFWESLKIKKLSDNISTYKLSKKQNLIKFGLKPQNLKKYFD